MESFSSLVETFLSVIKSIINNNILLPTGNIWISDVLIYHLFLVILITAIFSIIFNKLIIVFIRGWLRKSNFNIGKQLLEKKVLVPIGWAIPIIIFEAGLGSYSPEEGVISRLMKSLIILIFILSITRFISALSDVLKGNKTFSVHLFKVICN